MEEYRRPERKMAHKFMGMITLQLTPQQITELAHFYAHEK